MERMEYSSINGNNIDSVKSIYVDYENKRYLTKIMASSFTKKLEELDLSECYALKGRLPLSKCKNLKKLKITGSDFNDLTSIYKCTNLEYLYLYLRCVIYTSLEMLNKLKNIKHLELYNSYIDISTYIDIDIQNDNVIFEDKYLELSNLHTLILHNTSFDPYNTTSIYFDRNERIFENILKLLSKCTNLKILKIKFEKSGIKCAKFDNLKFINELTQLEELELTNCKIKNISILSKLKNLKKLTISKDSIFNKYTLNNIEVNVI